MLKAKLLSFLALLAVSTMLVGCDSSGRIPVKGLVSFDGTPVEKGYIHFAPLRGTKSPTSGANIVNGAFEVAATRGLMDGNYSVEVKAWKTSKKVSIDPVTGERSQGGTEQFLPAKYNTKSELKVEVKAGTESYDFDLKSE